MALGSDNAIAKTEFVEAMRQRLEDEKPGLGANVDEDGVQKNLGALGEAVFRIATVRAETVSDSTMDSAFWKWIADVNLWLSALSAWQQGVATAFSNWTPAQQPEKDLKNAITGLQAPGSPPLSGPSKIRGKIV